MLAVLLTFASVVCASVPMLGFLALFWWLDRYDREPLWLVGAVFLWGAVGAVVPAILFSAAIEYSANSALSMVGLPGTGSWFTPVVVAPLVEEPCKAVILLLLLGNRHFDNMTDGFVYGAAAGLGFAMTENLLYFVSMVGDVSQWGFTVLVRTFYSGLMHATATSMVGAALGFARFRGCFALLASGGMGFALAWGVHALWNGLISVGVATDNGLPMMVNMLVFPAEALLVFGVFQLCLLDESANIRRELREEAAAGRIPAAHPDILASWVRRVFNSGWLPRGVDRDQYVRSATRLAVRKRQARLLGSAAPAFYREEIDRLRGDVQRLLARQR